MKNRKFLIGLVMTIFCIIGFANLNSKAVHASYLNGNSYTEMCTRYVKVVKPINVYKVTTGHYEAQNHFKYVGKLNKGHKLWISRWLMSTGSGWVIIDSNKYYSSRRTFFFAHNPHSNRANWYKRIR